MAKPSLTQEQVLALFEYRDGELYWKNAVLSDANKLTASDKRHLLLAGRRVGSDNGAGYLRTSYRGKRYYVHQLVFLMFHGHMPKLLDHINGNRMDNRIENLREVTPTQNLMNTCIRKDNTSGAKGVYWNKNAQKWNARVQVNKKEVSLGLYSDYELACLMALEARETYYGQFLRRV